MKQYIETVGKIITKAEEKSPKLARDLLSAAYTFVDLTAKKQNRGDVRNAAGVLNSALAKSIVESLRHPEHSVMVNLFMPCELLHAMDISPMFPEGISTYLACTACQNVFARRAEDTDVPETFCSYHKTMIGLAESGVLPAPLMIANTTLACDANQLSFRRLAEYYHVPHTVIDIPYSVDEEAVHYVADQLRTLTECLEDVAHRKLNPEKLKASVACTRSMLRKYKTYLVRRGQISIPASMTGELCSLVATHVLLGSSTAEHYVDLLLDTTENASRNLTKKRIFWCHTLPNWQNSMLEITDGERCELVGNDLAIDWLGDPDPLHPYESMARRVVEGICNGPATRRINMVLEQAKLAHADGIVVFCHWGCKQTLGLSHLAKETFEQAGFPTLVLDGDGCDNRNVADGQMVTRMNAFLEELEGMPQ